MKKSIIAWVVLLLIVVIAGIFYYSQPKINYDSFTQCLDEKGAVFYGTFWCPHCQNQKKLFGNSQKLLPYVECSTPDGKSQLEVCKEKNIQGYPTWEFADGSRLSGEVTLDTLAQKTGCVLP